MMIKDESRELFADDGVDKWLREKREEVAQRDDLYKSEQWWAGLAEPERVRWHADGSGGTVLAAWLTWRNATSSVQ